MGHHPNSLKNLKPFVKGQPSANPFGRAKGVLSKVDVEVAFQKLITKTRSELQAVLDDQKSSMLEITVASILVKSAKEGDASRLETLLARAVGKVKDESVVEQHTHDHKELLRGVPTKEIVKLLDKDPDK